MHYIIWTRTNEGTALFYEGTSSVGIIDSDDYSSDFEDAKLFATYEKALEKQKELFSKSTFIIRTTENVF